MGLVPGVELRGEPQRTFDSMVLFRERLIMDDVSSERPEGEPGGGLMVIVSG